LPEAARESAAFLMNSVIIEYGYRVSRWKGWTKALTDSQERQTVWTEVQRYRGEFVQVVEGILSGRSRQFEQEVESASEDANTRLVVAFITDEAHNPVFLEGEPSPFTSTAVGNKNYPREAIVVLPRFADRGGEGSDRNLISVIAEICTPDTCPAEEPEVERVFEYYCRQTGGALADRERKPTLTIEWRLPDCCPVAIGEYRIENPPEGILIGERIEFIGGNVSYEWLLWPGRQWFITQYVQSTAACPMPGATLLLLEARSKTGTVHATGLGVVFSDQMIVTTIVNITGEGNERVITVNGVAGSIKPTDYFDYHIDEEVIVFGVGAPLTLPLNEDRELGGDFRLIPANFAGFGV
jgi:hypothetical protein